MASDIQQQLLLPFKDSDGGNVSICPLGCHIVGSFNPAQFRHMIKLGINSRSIRLRYRAAVPMLNVTRSGH